MNPKPDELIFRGKTASSGYAFGKIALRRPLPSPEGRKGAPDSEHQRLINALNTAREHLTLLKADSNRLGAQIIEFQLELIDDRKLTGPVRSRIDGGESASEAWRVELDAHISDYLAADDENFRARANDFEDLKDRILNLLHETDRRPIGHPSGAIYVTDDLTPSRFLETDWSYYTGAALAYGSAASHVAMLARAHEVPMVLGLGEVIDRLKDGAEAILDAEAGQLIQDPASPTIKKYEALVSKRNTDHQRIESYMSQKAMTLSGKRIKVYINVDAPSTLKEINPGFCDGVGLVRTEWMFHDPKGLPDEDTQYQVYRGLIQWAQGRPVVIRTLDAGGDKPIAGLTLEDETNPFMGLRGIRLSLARPEPFRVQLRALMRAAVHAPLKVVLPMVSDPVEMDRVREVMSREILDLERLGIEAVAPPLGIMVEVPAAALRIHSFNADFFSIGSNDLIQYVTAASRDCVQVAELHDPLNPAVLELIRRVSAYGEATGREVSLCGDMAAEPRYIPAVLKAGIKVLSVAPAALGKTKAAVMQHGK